MRFAIRTGIWVLQLLFEAWEGRTKGLGVLQEHFVHDQHCLLANVRLSVGHLRRMKGENERNVCSTSIFAFSKHCEWIYQSHDVIGQVTSKVRGHEAGKSSQGHAGVVLVRTTEILVRDDKASHSNQQGYYS